ncbi:hypothetical protein H4R33_006398, partial [Dimargaris cristalligena]
MDYRAAATQSLKAPAKPAAPPAGRALRASVSGHGSLSGTAGATTTTTVTATAVATPPEKTTTPPKQTLKTTMGANPPAATHDPSKNAKAPQPSTAKATPASAPVTNGKDAAVSGPAPTAKAAPGATISYSAAAAAAAAKAKAQPAPRPAASASTPTPTPTKPTGGPPGLPAPTPTPSNGGGAAPPTGPSTDKPSPSSSATSLAIQQARGHYVSITTVDDRAFEGLIYNYDLVTGCLVLLSDIKPEDRSRLAPDTSASATPAAKPDTAKNSRPAMCPPPASQRAQIKAPQGKRVDIIMVKQIKAFALMTSGATTEPPRGSGPMAQVLPIKEIPASMVLQTFAPQWVNIEKVQQRFNQSLKETEDYILKIGVGVTQEAQSIFDALNKTLPCRWAKDSIVVLDEVIIKPPYEPENCLANPSAASLLARVKLV